MSNLIPKLPARDPDSNKGTHGRGLLIAGSVGMSGAAVLGGTAMLRSGTGASDSGHHPGSSNACGAGEPVLHDRWAH